MNNAKLLRRAIVGIISGHEDKIDPASHVAVNVVDDAPQIEMILQIGFGHMEISDVDESQWGPIDQAGHHAFSITW
jgi:hypothetical protein